MAEGSGVRVTRAAEYIILYIRDVFRVEVDDGIDEVVLDDNAADRLPVGGLFTQQQADRLQRQLDGRRRVAHGAHLHQVLLLD